MKSEAFLWGAINESDFTFINFNKSHIITNLTNQIN